MHRAQRMALCGGFLLLSVFLGDIPTILAAAEVFGFMPTKVDRGEGTAGLNVNPARLFDIAYSIHEKSSKFLREHRKEAEKTTSQPDAEIIALSDKSPHGYNSANNTVDKSTFSPAENRSNMRNGSHMSLNNSTEDMIGYASGSSNKHDSPNMVRTDYEDYGDIRNEEVIGYSQCSEEGGDVNCKYVTNYKINKKREAPAETTSSLTDRNVHQHNNYSTISNFGNTIQNGSDVELFADVGISGNNKQSDNARNMIFNITAVLDTTKYPVYEKTAEVRPIGAPTSMFPKEQSPALKDLSRSRVTYETLLESTKSDSRRISDYPLVHRLYHSGISYQANHVPQRNSPPRDLCISCGPNGYCDISQDPHVCVCNFGLMGTPPDCYQPSEDHILHSYSMLLKRYSNDKVSSTHSPLTIDSKPQYTIVLQKNKGSAFPKK